MNFKRPSFWIALVLLFVICTGFTVFLFPKAFPLIDLEISLDRSQALKQAEQLAIQNHWQPSHFKQSAQFELDQKVQTYIELKFGASRFAKILKEGLYSPYSWRVRHFAEGDNQETEILFKPDGSFYGFREHLSEDQPGAALPVKQAQTVAEEAAKSVWSVPLSDFEKVEESKEIRPSGRVDHFFVYERPNLRLADARYRLRLTLSGDHLTEIRYFLQIPEAFTRTYLEMRSSNDFIALISNILMAVLYILGACGIGSLLLMKKGFLLWKEPLILSAVVSGLGFLEYFNEIPTQWMNYDTAIPISVFLISEISKALILSVSDFLLVAFSLIGAESLSRRAFPKHPQLWKIGTSAFSASSNILGQTLGGYLSVPLLFAFTTAAYFVGQTYFGWWSPSDLIYNPDALSHSLPWFTPIARSLHAGVWEEALFRAVPLATGALLGNYFKQPKRWIFAAFVLQALIFGAGHANYPAQPSYARVLELILPSFFFGALYLRFGLLPGIVLHFTFDVVCFALPLFMSQAPGAFSNQILLVIGTSIPLLWIFFCRYKSKRWMTLPLHATNAGWKPYLREQISNSTVTLKRVEYTKRAVIYAVALGLLSLAMIAFTGIFKPYASCLKISSSEAKKQADRYLASHSFDMTGWKTGIRPIPEDQRLERFVLQTGDQILFDKLMGDYVRPPSWLVRYYRFDREVSERAEEFQLVISESGKILSFQHPLPEGKPGATLTQKTAESRARTELEHFYGVRSDTLQVVSAVAQKRPSRLDWNFQFKDLSETLPVGECRMNISLSGDELHSASKSIFIPEVWKRKERGELSVLSVYKRSLILFGMTIVLMILSYAVSDWSKGSSQYWVKWRRLALFIFILNAIDLMNSYPILRSHFSTAQPESTQLASLLFTKILFLFLKSFGIAFIGAWASQIDGSKRRISDTILGLSLGASVSILSLILPTILPPLEPLIGSLESLDRFFPLLSSVSRVTHFCFVAVFFLALDRTFSQLTQHWTRRKKLAYSLLFLTGFLFPQTEELTKRLLLGGLWGGALIAQFRFLYYGHSYLIPYATAGILAADELKQAFLNSYDGVRLQSSFNFLCLMGVAVFWDRYLNRDPRKRTSL